MSDWQERQSQQHARALASLDAIKAAGPADTSGDQRKALVAVDERWDDPGEEYESVAEWWTQKERDGDYKRSMFDERWARDGDEYQIKYLGWVDEDGMSRFGDEVGGDFVDWNPVLRWEWTDEHHRSCRCRECDPDRYNDDEREAQWH